MGIEEQQARYVWINVTPANHKNLIKAFLIFGLPTVDITEENFLNEIEVFTYGLPPVSIDILKFVKGCIFEEAYKLSSFYDDNGLIIRHIHLNTLIQAKKAAGRFKDLDDIEKLSGL